MHLSLVTDLWSPVTITVTQAVAAVEVTAATWAITHPLSSRQAFLHSKSSPILYNFGELAMQAHSNVQEMLNLCINLGRIFIPAITTILSTSSPSLNDLVNVCL